MNEERVSGIRYQFDLFSTRKYDGTQRELALQMEWLLSQLLEVANTYLDAPMLYILAEALRERACQVIERERKVLENGR